MQFLAILKDSFREARNGWVLQAMLVLSGLLVLFIASISFTPTTVRRNLEAPLGMMNWGFRNNPALNGSKFEIDNYRESNPDEPWNSDYDFEFVVTAGSPEQLKSIDEMRDMPASRARVERFLNRTLNSLKNLKVEAAPAKTESERRFRVTSSGTKVKDVTAWPHVPKVLFAFEAPFFIMSLRNGVYLIENYIVGGAGAWIILFISVVITSGFIPNLLQKGAIDLAIAKPIGRSRLLIYKYFGGLIFTGLLTAFTVGGSWLVIGIRTGMWNHNFLAAIPLVIAYFSILYAVSTMTALLTRSAIVSILATLLAWAVLFGIGFVNRKIEEREATIAEQLANPNAAPALPKPGETPDLDGIIARIDPEAPLWGFIPKSLFGTLKVIHFVSPRTFQIDKQLDQLIAKGILPEYVLDETDAKRSMSASWPEILGVSAAFIVVVLGLACWRFETRSY